MTFGERPEPAVILRQRRNRDEVISRVAKKVLARAIVLRVTLVANSLRHGQADVWRICSQRTGDKGEYRGCYNAALIHLTRTRSAAVG